MKILYVASRLPFPAHTGGTLIAYHHIKYLARRHKVDLIAFAEQVDAPLENLATWCGTVRSIRLRVDTRAKARAAALKLIGIPGEISKHASGEMASAIRDALLHRQYDVAMFQSNSIGQHYPARCPTPAVLFIEDPASLKFARAASRTGSLVMRARLLLESALIRRYEREQALRFDRTLVLNRADLAEYRRQLAMSASLECLPYGIDVSAFPVGESDKREDGLIVISGNMRHAPNVEGVLFFANRVFPLVKMEYPTARLVVVGADPASEIRDLATADSAIKVTGTVPDVRPYLRRAKVSVCPIFLVIGTQTKILEAMASGTPVVTTPEGNYGVDGEAGRDLKTAATPSEFAEAVITLLRGEEWGEFSTRGRLFVESRFDWPGIVERLAGILEQVIAERPARRV